MLPSAGDLVCLAALALIVLGAVARRRGTRWAAWALATGVTVLMVLVLPDFVRGFRGGWNSALAASPTLPTR